jgi:integrase
MNLKVKRPRGRLTCGFCSNPFFPAPQISDPKTCGRPGCVKEYRRSTRIRKEVASFPNDLYHQVLSQTHSRGMRKEYFLFYILGETGILVSELCDIRPIDLYFEGPDKKIAIAPTFHKVSGGVAGTIERWIKEEGISKLEPIFPYTKRAAQKMFHRAIKAANIEESWGTRSLRHRYGLTVALATDDEKAVATALRQKDVCSARIYIRVARELLKGA